MIVAADIKEKFPGVFDSLDDDLIELYIDESELVVLESKWGDFYDLGLLYLTAHLLLTMPKGATSGGAGAPGPVSSRRVGDVAVGYSTVGSGKAPISDLQLASTSYGQRYLYYRRLIQGSPHVAVPSST